MKIVIKFFLCYILLSTVTTSSFAQAARDTIIREPKFKPPVVKTYLGVNQNGAQVTAEEGAELVGLPLKVTDAKNHMYIISSYQFLYRQKSYILDDQSGKKQEVFTISADRFNITPLPKVWVDNIRGRLQKDEQLYFFDIVVKDKEGRIFFAPPLKITIQ